MSTLVGERCHSRIQVLEFSINAGPFTDNNQSLSVVKDGTFFFGSGGVLGKYQQKNSLRAFAEQKDHTQRNEQRIVLQRRESKFIQSIQSRKMRLQRFQYRPPYLKICFRLILSFLLLTLSVDW